METLLYRRFALVTILVAVAGVAAVHGLQVRSAALAVRSPVPGTSDVITSQDGSDCAFETCLAVGWLGMV